MTPRYWVVDIPPTPWPCSVGGCDAAATYVAGMAPHLRYLCAEHLEHDGG